MNDRPGEADRRARAAAALRANLARRKAQARARSVVDSADAAGEDAPPSDAQRSTTSDDGAD